MTDKVEKHPPKTMADDEDSVEVEGATATDSDEKEKATPKKTAKGKKAVNSRGDDFRLRQLDFDSADAVFRKKWWQLW